MHSALPREVHYGVKDDSLQKKEEKMELRFSRLFSVSLSSGSGSSFEPAEIDFSVYTDMCNQQGYDAHFEVSFRYRDVLFILFSTSIVVALPSHSLAYIERTCTVPRSHRGDFTPSAACTIQPPPGTSSQRVALVVVAGCC